MKIIQGIFLNSRFLIRELIGLYRLIKSKKVYKSKDNSVYYSDYSKDSPKQLKGETFKSYFMRIEEIRKTHTSSKRISKNVSSSITYFDTASKFIPFLQKKCNLKTDSKVLDYGSGGLRCGFGLLDFLDSNSYSCADISESFLIEAKTNSKLLDYLFEHKEGVFYKIGKDQIPNQFYDLIISTYVVPHIPKDKLYEYFNSIREFLKKDGLFYFDFMPTPFCFTQNVTTFTYPYRSIIKVMNMAGLKLIKTYGSAIIAKKD